MSYQPNAGTGHDQAEQHKATKVITSSCVRNARRMAPCPARASRLEFQGWENSARRSCVPLGAATHDGPGATPPEASRRPCAQLVREPTWEPTGSTGIGQV